jgi:AraC family transcriptional regulator of adaptative response / DNA-3-methyladenine glycosylase II
MGTMDLLVEQREELLRRFYARELGDDGLFVGVVSTGIYCLPSCRARSPRPENVRFFASERDARGAGLRPCRRCRPDRWSEGIDPDRDRLRELAGRVRATPGTWRDARALCAEAAMGATKLNALFRRHYHVAPAAFLVRARVERAMELLAGERAGVLEAGEASGFESASAFHENFAALTGLTPGACRDLGPPGFTVRLPRPARTSELRNFLGRDVLGRTERISGERVHKALVLDGTPAVLALDLAADAVRVSVASERPLSRDGWRLLHRCVVRWLGLECDTPAFERRAARSPDVARLVRGRAGLRVPRSADAFEGLVWAVVGAQVNVAFAASCRTALIELAGTPCPDGFVAHPSPAQVARLEPAELLRCKLSRRKGEYLVDAARAIASGALDLEALRTESVSRVAERLASVRGLGPWSVQYLLLRAYGFDDCAPAGDVALAEALRRFHGRDERPEPAEVTRLMQPFAPHRSLASYHLWSSLRP